MSNYGHRNTTAQNMGLSDGGPAWTRQPASMGRKNFILNLLAERQVGDDAANRLRVRIANNDLNTSDAMAAIEWLKRQPKIAATAPARSTSVTITEPGFYRLGEAVYRVQQSKNSSNLYAKAVTAHGWDYEAGKGKVFQLTAEMKMSGAEIAAFGVNTGICANCSIQLDDPISKEIGLGTSCGPKLLGRPEYNAARKAAKAQPHVAVQLAAIKAAKTAAPAVADPMAGYSAKEEYDGEDAPGGVVYQSAWELAQQYTFIFGGDERQALRHILEDTDGERALSMREGIEDHYANH